MAATTALRGALNQGISSGNLVDTKIILYSHRDSSGRVCRPKALYASSCVLKTVPYFKDLRLETLSVSRSKDFSKDAIDDDESAEDYGYLSDSDLEDDGDEKVVASTRTDRPKVHPFGPFGVAGEDRKIPCEEYEEHVGKGKVIKIPDVAFVTFQAFLMYLYTNVIEFAPFGSNENRRSRSAEIVTSPDDNVPRPSPKSIYRLADKYNVPVLKTLALNHIRGELGKCDIVEESFSRFAFQYDEIGTSYIEQLALLWMKDSTAETIQASVDKKIDSFEGDFERVTKVLSMLTAIVDKDSDVKTPSNATPPIESPADPPVVQKGKKKRRNQKAAAPVKPTNPAKPASSGQSTKSAHPTSPAHWASVKIALIKSIRKGVLFDRKYWARHSKTGDALKPVYFSSIIMGDKMQQLNNLVKYLKGRNVVINDLEGGVNIDSDCEGDYTGAGIGILKNQKKEEESRAVLIVGSFSAWKSLFFYRCTDVISFAPLKSQGIDFRLNHIHRRTVVIAPPPCSPKSIYVLAKWLGIQPLCDSAFADIKSKVSLDNVVDEAFSWITAGQEEIMEMECELLISNFKDPKTIALVKENIGHISDGSSPHCAGALKLGLKKAFELKKQKRQPPGVLLRCSRYGCARNTTPVSYSVIGSNVYCQDCQYNYGTYYMQCVGCSYNRTGGYTSCQSCGKRFI